MRKNGILLRLGCALLISVGWGFASAQMAPGPPPSAAPSAAPAFPPPMNVYNGTREYVWTLPHLALTTEHVKIATHSIVPRVHGRRWDYEMPALVSKRFWLGQVPEFTCKYPDLDLPQHCRTVWHDVYADLPVFGTQRDHMLYDEVEWVWQDGTLGIDIPRWTVTEGTLTISAPVLTPEDTRHAQATLDAQQAAAAKAIDQGIAALDASIAAVKAQGADPRRLSTTAGTTVDLPAMRQALLDEKANELDRLERIRGEVSGLGAAVPTAREAPLVP